MEFVKVASLSEIPEDAPLRVEVDGCPIALCKAGGGIYAVSDTCTHEEASLSEGFLEDCTLECPRHGAQFDVRTGKVLSLPATEPLPTYEVRVEGDDVYVRLS